jgi:hypothetical protein
MYEGTLTTNQRQDVEGYLAWKWNIHNPRPLYSPSSYFRLQQNITDTGHTPLTAASSGLSYTIKESKLSALFTTVTSWLRIPFTSFMTGPFTICWWAANGGGGTITDWVITGQSDPTSAGGNTIEFSHQPASSGGSGISGTATVGFNYSPSNVINSYGYWHHYAFTWNLASNQSYLYVDGVLWGTHSGTMGGLNEANAAQ